MFFKKLEIFGFKSFAQKTQLDFEAGVTAIVGPNGCGKSNIADAIKWVLGEQSVRSMRGARMEDVIFHGADNVQPVGFAEVSLTISNQKKLLALDYEEVTLTRRIFRSGESEYLINKVPVRLKDILELLMDTGLGMSSYSIMEQGRVDQILNSRPEERRTIFEEASGITKYKVKKEESLRKLERTGENLQRVGDIIVEVKRQIKSMERQVNKAQRYKQEFEKLKEYELKVSQYQYQDLKKEKKNLEAEASKIQHEDASLSARMSEASSTLERMTQELAAIEENISSIKAKSYDVCASIKTTENKISLDKERIEELHQRRQDIADQIEGLEKKIAITSEQTQGARQQIESIAQRKEDKSASLTQKEAEINNILAAVKEAEKSVSENKAKDVEVIAEQLREKNNLTKLQTNLANFNARLRRLRIEQERTQTELNNIEEKYRQCNEENESLAVQLKQLTREIWGIRSNLDIKLDQKNKLTIQLEDINRQIASLSSKLNFAQEIARTYEGYAGGVKSILSAIDEQALEIEGLCGAVANLIDVEAQYQTAIEAALGESSQAIVAENKQAAYNAIAYLKKNNHGRVSFICLDSLAAHKEKRLRHQANLLGPALQFVKCESKYQKALEWLLADTYIVQDIESARSAIENQDPEVRFVALNGEILTKTSVSGGASAENPSLSLLGRKERIAQLEAELEKKRQEKTDLDSLKANQESETKELQSLIQHKEPELNKLKIKLANKETEKTNIETERKRFQDELAVLKLEIDETDEQAQQLNTEQQELDEKLLQLQADQKELVSRIENNEALIAERGRQRENSLVEIAEIKTQLEALDKEAESAQLRLEMILESEKEQQELQQKRQKDSEEASLKIEQLKEEIAQCELRVGDFSQTNNNLQEKLAQSESQRHKASSSIQNLQAQARENQKGLDQIRKRQGSLQVRVTELNYKQDSLKDRMQQSYQVDLQATLEDALELSPSDNSMLDEIQQLKTKLEGMGPVNLVAIEENDQLQQRYSFLISQQEDLVKAQESLRKAIVQINHTARTMFAETFEKIQANFKEYFRILFSGGDARLILLDENNILESGIEIVVRPPGKKLQNISLLSGGEKAMTTIALLFAIFKVKPSPFCLLDEVDAPLDESNVDRFTNLLAEFIKTSQFIIVTHNKKTINMADIMYGITMEKSGVSKIVSVKFSQEPEAPAEREVAQVE